jgi:predicted ATP-binding protein involved in virulence
MRITRIFVEKLFGIFDHEIPLNLDDRITIIHAPNGYGKTVILKMLNGLLNSRYNELLTIPYKRFEVEFDDGRRLEVSREMKTEIDNKSPNLSFTIYSNHKDKPKSFTIKYIREALNPNFPLAALEEFVPGLLRLGSRTWLYKLTGEEFSTTEEVLDRFSDQIPLKLMADRQEERWLTEVKEEVSIYLIESQRLLNFSNDGNFDSAGKVVHSTPRPTVNTYSDELVQEIKERANKYALVSQSLDRSFPIRVIRQRNSDNLTNKDLRDRWDELEKHRNRLVDVGLLEKDDEQNPLIQSQDDIDESTKNFLAVYIEDVEKKLDTFGDIARKIDLFRKIVNSKFSNKEMVVSREKGFIFRSKYPEGSEYHGSDLLALSSLSSGEQHELVLLYELLFKVKEKSLVLIDEPEISLHIGWQVNFLKDLQEISKLADLDLLIATHAPSLIADCWDLTVELKGVS